MSNELVIAQNLILNGDFEEYHSIPTTFSEINLCKHIINPSPININLAESTTPDYFHMEGYNTYSGYETNDISAHSQNGFIGVFGYLHPTMYREYVQLIMSEPLKQGVIYQMQLFIANGKYNPPPGTFAYRIPIATNSFQIKFLGDTITQFKQNPIVLDYDYSIDSAFYSEDWVEIKFTYTALGNEKYILIGNLIQESKIIQKHILDDSLYLIPFYRHYSYFFIDNASLVQISDHPLTGDTLYSICKGDSVRLSISGDSLVQWYELPFDNKIAVNDTSIVVNPQTTTQYRVIGRTDSLDIWVEVRDRPKQPFTDTIICFQSSWYLPTPSTFYDSVGVHPEVNPITPQTKGRYALTQWLNGCSLTDTIHIQVEDCEVALSFPNIITPNGDGKNEVFKPLLYKGVKKAHLEVYNRWGKNIFESNEVEQGWDGKEQSSGVYFWICTYTDRNDQESYLKGNVLIEK